MNERIVVDPKTGEILAMANYPIFRLWTFARPWIMRPS